MFTPPSADDASSSETPSKTDQSEKEISNAGSGVSTNQSQKRYWLASGSNDYELEIYDLSSIFSKLNSLSIGRDGRKFRPCEPIILHFLITERII